MEIFKIIGIGILGAVIAGLLKTAKPEFAIFATLATGIIILIMLINSFNQVIGAFYQIVDKSGISDKLFQGILKIIGIGYLTEYSASICEDYGTPSIAKKLQLSGKIVIFLMALPILTSLIDVVSKLVQ
ncbi:MAG: SpoIIIAC/SpoIIIAD family protein [Clostridia bacterium]